MSLSSRQCARCFSSAVVSTGAQQAAWALPPAGSDYLAVVVTVDTASRLGKEPAVLIGWAEVNRDDLHLE